MAKIKVQSLPNGHKLTPRLDKIALILEIGLWCAMAWLRTFSSRSSTRQSSRINTQHSLPTERLCLNITNQWAQTHLNRLQWECVGKQLIKQKWQRQSPSRQRDSVKAWDVIYLAQSNSRNVPVCQKQIAACLWHCRAKEPSHLVKQSLRSVRNLVESISDKQGLEGAPYCLRRPLQQYVD